MRANKLNGSNQIVIRSGLGRTVRDIKIFASELQPSKCQLIYLLLSQSQN